MKVKDLINVMPEIEEVKIVDLKVARTWKGLICEIPSYYHEREVKNLYSSFVIGDDNKYTGITII